MSPHCGFLHTGCDVSSLARFVAERADSERFHLTSWLQPFSFHSHTQAVLVPPPLWNSAVFVNLALGDRKSSMFTTPYIDGAPISAPSAAFADVVNPATHRP